MPTAEELKTLIHNPAQLASQYLDFAQRLQKGGLVEWGVGSLDKCYFPLPPGFVMGILGRPGHGKSTVLAYLARHNAEKIVAANLQQTECVVFVTLDQSAEEMEAFFQCGADYTVTDLAWGNVDMEIVRRKAVQRPRLPIWTLGKSIVRRGKHIRLTVDNMYNALRLMETEHHIHPRLICLDYLQIVPVDHARERIQQVTEAIVQAKELAEEIGAVMIIASQANRRVDDYDEALPSENDSMWSSGFEQNIDRGFSIWRPGKRQGVKEIEDRSGKKYPVTQNLFVMRNWKARFSEPGNTFYLHFDPRLARLADLETAARESLDGRFEENPYDN